MGFHHSFANVRGGASVGHKLHSAELNPRRIIWINPSKVLKGHNLLEKRERRECHVIDGEWDQEVSPFSQYWLCRFLMERFVDGQPWAECAGFKTVFKYIEERGAFWHGCCHEQDVLERCAKVDKLYSSIINDGYIIPQPLEFGFSGIAVAPTPDAVAVNVGRQGQFIYENGTHRLSIALALGFSLIPVRVVVRHKHWQDIRERLALTRSVDRLDEALKRHIQHPDVQYLGATLQANSAA